MIVRTNYVTMPTRGMGGGLGQGDTPSLDLSTLFPGLAQVSGTEWVIIAVGAYMLLATFLQTKQGVSKVTGRVRKYRARRQRRKELEEEYRGLGWF